MQSCGMQQENEVPTQNIMEMLLCLCGPTKQNKMHMFQKHFLPFITSKITEKVELTKKATGKASFFVDVKIFVLTQQICIVELSNQIL